MDGRHGVFDSERTFLVPTQLGVDVRQFSAVPRVFAPALSLVLVLVLVFAAPSSARADETPITIGTSYTIDSALYGAERTVNVFLPLSYESGASYPVLYVLDGGVRQDFLNLVGMGALAWLSGQYREFVVVGVQTENRYHELTAPSDVKEDNEINPDNGGAATFRRHVVDEVKPFVEAKLRTSGEDAVIGESLAGLFIAETFLREPTAFDHYVAISPSLWWRNMGLADEAPSLLGAEDFPSGRSLYVTLADEGGMMLEGVERFVNAVEAEVEAARIDGLRLLYDPMPSEHHHTIYKPAQLAALRWIFASGE